MGVLRLPHVAALLRTYFIPVAAVACATALRAGLIWLESDRYTFGLFYLAVAFSAWYGGLRQGLVALAAAAVASALLLPPIGRPFIRSDANQVEWAVFVAISLALCLIIDARNREKEKARSAEATLHALIELAPVGIALLDREMRFRVVNKALADMNGIPAARHIGKTVGEVLPQFEPLVRKHFEEVLRTGRSVEPFELAGDTPAAPGQQRVWLEAWFPVHGANEEVIGVGAIVEEITERRKHEDAVKALSERKSEFVAVLGHELRTPLGALATALDILSMKAPDVQTARSLGIAQRQVKHMKRLADDLFDMSRLSGGRLWLDRRPVSIGALLEDVVNDIRPAVAAKQQQLEFEIADATVVGDAQRLSQIFYNLLQNASKFTPAGGAIGLKAEKNANEVRITMRDNGIGIPEDSLEVIFDMWARGRNGERMTGLGIGLALARELVERHGGTITASSAGPGQGAEFTVRLPLEQ